MISNNNLHPISIINDEMIDFFISHGYKLFLTNEIRSVEEEYESVAIAAENPVRDFSRTFYVNEENVLQGHLSSLRKGIIDSTSTQENYSYIVPGRIYRVIKPDCSHNIISHQLEGIASMHNISIAAFTELIKKLFTTICGDEQSFIFTPDFTIFTSPTIQFYYKCYQCGGSGCELCQGKGKNIFGAGGIMANSYNSTKKISNLSFCMSVDRLAMFKYRIKDARDLYLH
jgi:phenylalanyl-tRNA synthetase alpha chain